MTEAQKAVKKEYNDEVNCIELRKMRMELLKSGIIKIEPKGGFLWVYVNDIYATAVPKNESRYEKTSSINAVYCTVRAMNFWFTMQEQRRLAA